MLETYRYSAGKFPVTFFEFKLTGSDVGSFLQNQSTHNFSQLPEHKFHLTSFLDPHGRVEFYAWALKGAEDVTLLTPVLLHEKAKERLEKFLISEDVEIHSFGQQEWTFCLGPKSQKSENSFRGILFEELAFLSKSDVFSEIDEMKESDIELWRGLNGWPSFDGSDFKNDLINHLRLYDLSVSPNKGCYPGQETVSKIATRRGAAYSPVLLESSEQLAPGPIFNFEKKIGEATKQFMWANRYYVSASLLRDFRVEKMNLKATVNGQSADCIVCYYPLLPGDNKSKAEELFHAGSDFFKVDKLDESERCFRLAIELDPTFADAYESLGVMLGRLERFTEAIELMDQLSKVDSTSVLAHTNKSLYLMRLGKIEEAEEEKSLATIKSFQKFGDEAKLKEKMSEQKKAQEEEWAKREDMFKQVLEIDDEDTLANYGLGSIAVERQDWEKAETYLQKVLKADPTYSVAYLALGRAYKGLGKKEEALATWREGVTVAAKKGDLMPANQMQSEIQNI